MKEILQNVFVPLFTTCLSLFVITIIMIHILVDFASTCNDVSFGLILNPAYDKTFLINPIINWII